MAAVTDILKMTPAEFEAYATTPDNADRRLELIGGEVVDVVSGEQSSSIGAKIIGELYLYLRRNPIGFLTGADGGYAVGEDRYIPDVGFVPYTHTATLRKTAYNTGLALAIEVLSPTDDPKKLNQKLFAYFQAGVVVWLVDPADESVTLFDPQQPTVTLRRGEVLAGDPVLPGLNLPIADVFVWPGQPRD